MKVFEITDNFQRPIDINTYSSGRVEDWKSILKKCVIQKLLDMDLKVTDF